MRRLATGLLAAVFAIVACSPQSGTPPSSAAPSASAVRPVRGGTLVLVTDAQPATYDLHQETNLAALDLLAPEYSLLYRVSPIDSSRLVPDLATGAVTFSADKLTATVKIRDGVKFHDGAALTAADVVATYQKIIATPPRGATYSMVDSVTAPDATTVVFKLKTVSASFATLLASPWNVIYSAAKLKQDPHFYETTVDGTGPFIFVSNAKGSEFVAKRNDAYFGKDSSGAALPYLDGFRALIVPDAAARVDAIKTKKAMLDPRGVTPAERDDIARAIGPDLALQEATTSCVEMLFPSTSTKPFDDVRVRQALTGGIDRNGGKSTLSAKANVKAVGGLVRPGNVYALADADLQKVRGFGTDAAAAQAAAKKLLSDAGQASLTLQLGTSSDDAAIGDYVIDQWKQIGVTATRAEQTHPPRAFDIALQRVCFDLDDPDLVLGRYRGAFGDTKLDGMIDAQSKETDVTKRASALGDAQKYILDEKAYAFPVLWADKIVPHLRTVRGWQAPLNDGSNEDLGAVWIAP